VKSTRTKAQELVNALWGPGRFMVKAEDVPQLAEYLRTALSAVFAEEYVSAIARDLSGTALSSVDKQRRFHLIQNLDSARDCMSAPPPEFLQCVDYSEDRLWTLADMSEALFGQHGNVRVYTMDIPKPENGSAYTTEEVKGIADDSNG